MSTLEFAKENLFEHLGINVLDWEKRNKGFYDGSGLGLRMKPVDLMKIGQLLQYDGAWNDTQVISKEWVKTLFDESKKSKTDWGLKDSKHGYCWYKSQIDGTTIDYGMGYGGQFILMIPSKELIIVTTHNHDTADGIPHQMKFLYGKLPAILEAY